MNPAWPLENSGVNLSAAELQGYLDHNRTPLSQGAFQLSGGIDASSLLPDYPMMSGEGDGEGGGYRMADGGLSVCPPLNPQPSTQNPEP